MRSSFVLYVLAASGLLACSPNPPDGAASGERRPDFIPGPWQFRVKLMNGSASATAATPEALYWADTLANPSFKQAGAFDAWVRADDQFSGNLGRNAPCIASWDKRLRADVFYKGHDGHMKHVYTDDRGQTLTSDDWGMPSVDAGAEWEGFAGAPSAASWRAGQVAVYSAYLGFFGPSNRETKLVRRNWDNGQWSDWRLVDDEHLGPSTELGVTAVSWGPKRTDVFVLTDNPRVFDHSYTDDDATFHHDQWTIPASLPDIKSRPLVASWGSGRLDLFYQSASGEVLHGYWDNGAFGWDSWASPQCPTGQVLGLQGADADTFGGKRVTVVVECGAAGDDDRGERRTFARTANPSGLSDWQEITPAAPSGFYKSNQGALLYLNF
jgi:hypothetical protein